MKATVNWKGDLSFSCKTDTGHKLLLDGNGKAMTPMESVLVSAGACSSVDVVDILTKSRKQVDDCVCELTASRADQPPRVFKAIHAHYIVKGEHLTDKQVARAVQLSAEKYCSVMLMLVGKVTITTSYALN